MQRVGLSLDPQSGGTRSHTCSEDEQCIAYGGEELPVLDQNLDFPTRAVSPEVQVERIRRVLAIQGFQDLDELIAKGQVDLDRLLELRETRECREFRDWLWSIDSTTDVEIEERVNSLRDKLSWFARGEGGKTIRWVASTGIGLMSGVGGTAVGLLDTFLLEKILPDPGPLSFLSTQYPSIFREKNVSGWSRNFAGP